MTASASARDRWIPGQAASSTRPQVRYHGHAAGPQTATAISAIPRLRTMVCRRDRHSSTAASTTLSPNATTPSADSRPRAPTGTTCATVHPSAVAGVIARRTLSGVENTVVEIHPSPRPVIRLTAATTSRGCRADSRRTQARPAPRRPRPHDRINTIAAAAGSLIVAANAHTTMPRSGRRSMASDDAGDQQTDHQEIVVGPGHEVEQHERAEHPPGRACRVPAERLARAVGRIPRAMHEPIASSTRSGARRASGASR